MNKVEYAIQYVTKGWSVFPTTNKKRPLTSNGCKGATKNSTQISTWWDVEFPQPNIGVATGVASGFWVVDIDMKDDVDGFNSLVDEYGDDFIIHPTKQLIGKTPSGGLHIPFQWEDDMDITTYAGVLSGVDIRGEGGYVLVEPSSLNIDNNWIQYQWNDINLPIPKAPTWAKSLLKKAKPDSSQSTFDVNQIMTGMRKGRRDTELLRYACHLKGCKVPYDLAYGFVLEAAHRCIPPFPEYEAIQKLNWAYKSNITKQIGETL